MQGTRCWWRTYLSAAIWHAQLAGCVPGGHAEGSGSVAHANVRDAGPS